MNSVKKIISLLNKKQLRKAIVLLALMIIGMVLEMLGVGLVVPVLALMTTSDIVTKYPGIEPIYLLLGEPSKEQMVVIALGVMLVVYAFKSSFLTYLTWLRTQYVVYLKADFSQFLFNGYLRQPYVFHLQRNSAKLMRNITSDVGRYGKSVRAALGLVADTLNFFGILIVLLWVELFGTTVVIFLTLLLAVSYNLLMRSRLSNLGQASRHHAGQGTQHLLQGLGGVKDVKLLGREDDFQSQYNTHNRGAAKVEFKHKFLMALPSLWFEFIAVIGLVSLIGSMLIQQKPLIDFVPTLGIFAAATFRLMPATGRILKAIQELRYLTPSVVNLVKEIKMINENEAIAEELEKAGRKSVGKIAEWKSLQIENVTYEYGNGGEKALNGINLAIPKGASVGIIGESGAGKSTLIDVFLGLLSPTQGCLLIHNEGANTRVDIKYALRAWQDQIGYVPQSIYLTDDTLRRNVAFGITEDQIDDAAVKKALISSQLQPFVDDLKDGWDTVVGENGVRLSGGQRQRIGIARALYHNPSILVLDEATSALDSETEREVMQAVEHLHGEKTILIIAHRLSTVAKCDKLYRLEKGKVIQEGSYEEVVSI